MAELDTIQITNPTSEDFTVNFNGEPYTIKGNETLERSQFLALHIAKHLSDRIVQSETAKKFSKKKVLTPHDLVVKQQLEMQDNPGRRIALYTILRDKNNVERVIKEYPQFKGLKNFVGDINEYDEFVVKYEKSKEPKETPKE